MNRSTPRVAALVAAPLLVVAATALVLVPRGGEGPPPPSPDGPSVVIVAPVDRAVLELGPVAVRAELDDPEGITAAELRVDDAEVASEITSGGSSADVRFDWEPDDPGDYTLLVRARDVEGNWGQAAVTVSVGTGEPPLPPPPTTSPRTTVALTTTSAPTTVAPSTTATTSTPPTTLRPTTVAPTAPPTNPPTAPPTPPPTSPTTVPTTPPSTAATTTTVPATTTIAATTTTATTAAPSVRDCRGDAAILLLPTNGSSSAPLQPTFAWGYFGACNPVSQLLRLRASAGASVDVPLPGSTRVYQLSFALPACTDVRWDVVALDAGGQSRGSRNVRFTTAGC